MKKLTKILSMLILSVLALTMMMGCGSPKLPADQSANIVLDIIVKADNSRISDIGISEEEYQNIRKKFEDSAMASFDSSGYKIKDETKKLLLDSMIEAFGKIKYETKLISEEKETAKVEVNIYGLDINKVVSEINPIVEKYYNENPNATQDEIIDYTFKKEAEIMKKGYITETPNTLTLTLTKVDNVWIPDESAFVQIGQALVA